MTDSRGEIFIRYLDNLVRNVKVKNTSWYVSDLEYAEIRANFYIYLCAIRERKEIPNYIWEDILSEK
ncbi:hypothetical protein CP10139811_0516 [Chlamydia ibidis]|uniref:Uncharacterized protein n=2 Tax=Chlamydia ibidis TaxID=1405396 RepID=S7KJP1_9CHLA|nr:hypothetical protein CP10139811_0516 [Chlamydia ibidis]EQM62507.1 hypothetical protein H359_0895 [Chlamydia ibidis 10-1398/6]